MTQCLLAAGGTHDVRISHVENGAKTFYVQLTSNLELIGELSKAHAKFSAAAFNDFGGKRLPREAGQVIGVSRSLSVGRNLEGRRLILILATS